MLLCVSVCFFFKILVCVFLFVCFFFLLVYLFGIAWTGGSGRRSGGGSRDRNIVYETFSFNKQNRTKWRGEG